MIEGSQTWLQQGHEKCGRERPHWDATGRRKGRDEKHGLKADIDAVICKIKLEVTHGNLAKMED